MTRQVCIVLHDVAPATWPQCARALALLDEVAAAPLTLLVVPDFHGTGRIDRDAEFRRTIDARLQRGDELALHGFDHRDAMSAPRAPLDWLRRRVLTAGEGEFAALDETQAREKLQRGLKLFERLDWPVTGFVPPAWLASAGTRAALRDSGLRYTSTHASLIDLHDGRRFASPCLTASPRSAWRRAASRAWLRATSILAEPARLIRLGLHPGDFQHEDLTNCWTTVLKAALRRREAVTKSDALQVLGVPMRQPV